MIIKDINPSTPSKELALYTNFYTPDEIYAGLHRYEVSFYGWSRRLQKFICYKKTITHKKGDEGEREVLSLVGENP